MIKLEDLQSKLPNAEIKVLDNSYIVSFEDYTQDIASKTIKFLQIFCINEDDCIVETSNDQFLVGGLMGKNINCWAKYDNLDAAINSL